VPERVSRAAPAVAAPAAGRHRGQRRADSLPVAIEEVRLGGRRVRFRTAGAGEPVVLVHGLSGSGAWWAPVLAALATRFRVHVVDLPGFGLMRRQGGLAPPRAAAWLQAWSAAAGLERPHVVGHSLGGYVALLLAAGAPGAVGRLALLAPAVLPPGGRLRGYAGPLLRSLRQAPPAFLPVLLRDSLQAGPATVWRAARDLLTGAADEALADVVAPVLLVWGSQDAMVPLATGQRLRAALPRSRLLVLEGAGHVPMYERPHELSAALLAYLQGAPVGV
jgi:pimeloyl-ACP methyl ester carboxylesterase